MTKSAEGYICDSYTDRILGMYKKTSGTRQNFMQFLHVLGSGMHASFELRWGRVGAKKIQSRHVSYIELHRALNKCRFEEYEFLGGEKRASEVAHIEMRNAIAGILEQKAQSVQEKSIQENGGDNIRPAGRKM